MLDFREAFWVGDCFPSALVYGSNAVQGDLTKYKRLWGYGCYCFYKQNLMVVFEEALGVGDGFTCALVYGPNAVQCDLKNIRNCQISRGFRNILKRRLFPILIFACIHIR